MVVAATGNVAVAYSGIVAVEVTLRYSAPSFSLLQRLPLALCFAVPGPSSCTMGKEMGSLQGEGLRSIVGGDALPYCCHGQCGAVLSSGKLCRAPPVLLPVLVSVPVLCASSCSRPSSFSTSPPPSLAPLPHLSTPPLGSATLQNTTPPPPQPPWPLSPSAAPWMAGAQAKGSPGPWHQLQLHD